MRDENTRDTSGAAIQAGKLPNRNPARIWGGRGLGTDCAICGIPVTHDQIAVEIEFDPDEYGPDADSYHSHRSCFAAWELDRRHLEPAGEVISLRDQTAPATSAPTLGGPSETHSHTTVRRHLLRQPVNDVKIRAHEALEESQRGRA
jgi:hypothetical protein